jgi:hypothetical protein
MSHHSTESVGVPQSGDLQIDLLIQSVLMLGQRLAVVDERVSEIHRTIMSQRLEKEWYTTTELAEAMNKSQFTVQERWCNDGRIECEKDPETGKWRIPGHEFRRIVAGGGLLPKRR